MFQTTITALGILLMTGAGVDGSLVKQTVDYKHGDKVLEGYLAYQEEGPQKRPAVIVFHDWNGIDDYERGRADMLAELGYVAFAADIYGKGIRPEGPAASSQEAGKYYQDVNLFRGRVNAALEYVKGHSLVDASKVAAIGYCFGGRAALELARSGADMAGVVSFHGGLKTEKPAQAGAVKAALLVLHGTDDPHVPASEVAAFNTEMIEAKLGYTLVSYAGAVHSFTHKDAGNDPSRGSAYNEAADKASWVAMQRFLGDLFLKNLTP